MTATRDGFAVQATIRAAAVRFKPQTIDRYI